MHKDPEHPPSGIVRWHVNVTNQNRESVASYTILTLIALKNQS